MKLSEFKIGEKYILHDPGLARVKDPIPPHDLVVTCVDVTSEAVHYVVDEGQYNPIGISTEGASLSVTDDNGDVYRLSQYGDMVRDGYFEEETDDEDEEEPTVIDAFTDPNQEVYNQSAIWARETLGESY